MNNTLKSHSPVPEKYFVKNIVRFVIPLVLLFTTAACSIDAELFAGSLHNEVDPDDGGSGNGKTAYTNGVYGIQYTTTNGYESFVVKRNAQGVFEQVEKTDALALMGIQAIGKSLFSTAVDLQTSEYTIHRLTGLTQTEVLSDVYNPSYNRNFIHNNKFYVHQNNNNLVSIDENGTVSTVCANCPISDKRKISGNFAMIEVNGSNTDFYVGTLPTLNRVSIPSPWTLKGSDQSILLGQIVYAPASTITPTFSIIKIENGVSTVIPTSGDINSLGAIGSVPYATMSDSGTVYLIRVNSNNTTTQLAALGPSSGNPRIVGQNSAGLFILKEDVSPNSELFFYDGTFTKISNFQYGADTSTIFDVRAVKDGIVYTQNTVPYFSNQTTHTVLSNSAGCLNSNSLLYVVDNIIYSSNATLNTCRLNGSTFEIVLTESLGSLTEIK